MEDTAGIREGERPEAETEASEGERRQTSGRRYGAVAAAIALACAAMAVAAMAAAWAAASSAAPRAPAEQNPPPQPAASAWAEDNAPETPAAAGCEHEWQVMQEIVEVPAKTHEVRHEAVLGTRLEEHTVCNECFAVIDGATERHAAETGHAGYSTNVPVEVEYVEREAWAETVVDEPARQELAPGDRAVCALCGDEKVVRGEGDDASS